MNDILLPISDGLFSLRAAGILVRNGKVLLQAPKDNGDYTFPGGHVAFGETSADTLRREWKEEAGVDITVGRLRCVEENFWNWNGDDCHQIQLSYTVVLEDEAQILLNGSFVSKKCCEGNNNAIWFHWVPLDEVKNLTVYPVDMAELLMRLEKDAQHFIYKEI